MTRKSDPTIRELFSVVTVAEAAERWHYSPTAVYAAIDRCKLDARKSGDTWLITTDSLIRYWGKPDPPNLQECSFTLPRWRRIA